MLALIELVYDPLCVFLFIHVLLLPIFLFLHFFIYKVFFNPSFQISFCLSYIYISSCCPCNWSDKSLISFLAEYYLLHWNSKDFLWRICSAVWVLCCGVWRFCWIYYVTMDVCKCKSQQHAVFNSLVYRLLNTPLEQTEHTREYEHILNTAVTNGDRKSVV